LPKTLKTSKICLLGEGILKFFINLKNGRIAVLRYREIKNLLMAEIAKMKANDRLPSRLELCKKLDTTRMTLDKAINELVTEGLLFSRRGDGTYVAGVDDQMSISTGQSWGVIVRDVRKVFYSEIVRGVEDVAQSYGINIILGNSDEDFEKQEQYIKRLSHSGVSGLIIAPVVNNDAQRTYRFYCQLKELKIPIVFCSRNVEGINVPMVASNNFYGGYIATKHLLEQGYRHIAYIAAQKYRASVDRCEGYITALLENGIEINRKIIKIEEQSQPQYCSVGYAALKKFLTSGQLVDAVFCFNERIAQGVYQAIVEAGLRVSDDIGVAGYDNSDICEKLTPAVTSVAYKNLEIGTKAAEVLYKQISSEFSSEFEFYLFNPELVVRDSCLGPKNRREAKGAGQEEEGVGCG
jgi:DNA-binding LacI/PurR family transcriptional regulator